MKKILKNKNVLIVFISFVVLTILILVNIIRVNLGYVGSGDNNIIDASTGGLKSNEYYETPYSPTEYQKELYNSLTKSLSDYNPDLEKINSEDRDFEKEIEICNLVMDNWVADFFTWTNKNSSYDVGGMQYIYTNSTSIYDQARETYYEDLDGYIAQYGRENLPEVNDIYSSGVVYGGTGYAPFGNGLVSYYGEAYWTYKECSIDTSEFQKGVAVILIMNEETGAWQIAQITPLG